MLVGYFGTFLIGEKAQPQATLTIATEDRNAGRRVGKLVSWDQVTDDKCLYMKMADCYSTNEDVTKSDLVTEKNILV